MSNALIIRADASTRMGTGHVMRCIALGQAWQGAGGMVSFVSCCDSDGVRKRILDEGFNFVELSGSYPRSDGDLTTTLKVARQERAVWIVVDGYHFDLFYQQELRRAGIKLLVLDDYNHLDRYEADILLNQNPSADELDYCHNSECLKLAGLRYALLRREFRRASPRKTIGSPVRQLLVSAGGSDPDNVSFRIIELLHELDIADIHVRIIVGSANPHMESLRVAIKDLVCQVELMTNVSDMPALLRWADFAVSAAGSTCWELAVLGVPFVTIVLARNQTVVADGLERCGVAPSLGWLDEGFRERFIGVVGSVLKHHSAVDRLREGVVGVVDRFGVDRILCRMTDSGMYIYKNRLRLRPVQMGDASLLLDWANDPTTRANSFNSEPIGRDDHIAWLKDKLRSEDSVMMVMELDGVPCGHIRYDREGDTGAILSYVVSPPFRGMKLGRQLVELSRDIVLEKLNAMYIKAITFVENTASKRIFESAGFKLLPPITLAGRACNEFTWSRGDGK